MTKKRFVFNDPKTKNSYGFMIPTEGISLKRFKANPMMLDSHYNSTSNVLGKWEDIQVEKGLLSGVPLFDTEDESVNKIAGKVERDFIKSCSMGITFRREDMQLIGGVLVLTKCELYEVSIVAVPSNANSIRLYASDTGKLMTEDEVKELTLSISTDGSTGSFGNSLENENNKNRDMKITLTAVAAVALGLGDNLEIESTELSAKIVVLESEKKASELKLSALLQVEEQKKIEAVNKQVDLAFKQGKITAEKKDEFAKLGIANPELLTATLEAIPAKQSLGTQTQTPTGGTEVKTVEEFQKLSLTAQLEFKQTNTDKYLELFTKK